MPRNSRQTIHKFQVAAIYFFLSIFFWKSNRDLRKHLYPHLKFHQIHHVVLSYHCHRKIVNFSPIQFLCIKQVNLKGLMLIATHIWGKIWRPEHLTLPHQRAKHRWGVINPHMPHCTSDSFILNHMCKILLLELHTNTVMFKNHWKFENIS